jgi:hypothetical protein
MLQYEMALQPKISLVRMKPSNSLHAAEAMTNQSLKQSTKSPSFMQTGSLFPFAENAATGLVFEPNEFISHSFIRSAVG